MSTATGKNRKKVLIVGRMPQAGVDVQASGSLDFLDPWGNHVQVVDYRDIQFTKAPAVLRAMGIDRPAKTDAAREELRQKGVAD